MEELKRILLPLIGLAGLGVTFWSYAVPDAKAFQKPELARIFFWHFPCPILATVLLILGAWCSLNYLRTSKLEWDVRSEAAHELGYVLCVLTMLTGIMFSYVQWGAWWQWDPRQTSFLLVLLVYLAYFVLRMAFQDGERKAANSAAYSLAALLPVLFLIFVFPRLPQIAQASFHPTKSIMAGEIKGAYAQVIVATMTLMSVLCVILYQMRVKVGLAELAAETDHGNLEDHRLRTAVTGVVRPVSLSSEDRPQTPKA